MTSPTALYAAHALGPNDWVRAALDISKRREKGVMVFVVKHYGSTPRNKGSWIYVRPDQLLGTLGGGEVERVVERDVLIERVVEVEKAVEVEHLVRVEKEVEPLYVVKSK